MIDATTKTEALRIPAPQVLFKEAWINDRCISRLSPKSIFASHMIEKYCGRPKMWKKSSRLS
jgi:hypothetical protein